MFSFIPFDLGNHQRCGQWIAEAHIRTVTEMTRTDRW